MAQMSIIMIFQLTQKSRGWTGQKEAASELHTFTPISWWYLCV